MDHPAKIKQWLEFMDQPAFCVENGIITVANGPALGRFVPVNEAVAPLLVTGEQEYAEYTGGQLRLLIRLGGTEYPATVHMIDGLHIFRLEEESASQELRGLSLIAQELRMPLSNAMNVSDRLLPSLEGDPRAAHLNQGLHQLLRIITNLSSAARYSTSAPSFEGRDIDALLRELVDHAVPLCESKGIRLEYTGLSAPAYSRIDVEQLEQSVYQLLSNAMKHTGDGGTIRISLTQTGKALRLTVQDSGSGLQSANAFDRFRREPSINDTERGVGLGLRIVSAFASAHGGAVLLTSPEGSGLRVMVSLPIRMDDTGFRSPISRISYTGGRDPALIALSDSLPPELYKK